MERISAFYSSIRGSFERGIYRSRNYSRVLIWLVRDAFLKRFWAKSLRLFIYAGMRMACQAGAVAILYFYANALKYGKNLSLLSLDLPARESILLMWSVIVLSFVMFALASVFQYLSRVTSIALGSTYEEDSSRQALRIISRLPSPCTPSANELLRSGAWKKSLSDARRAGMTIRTIGYSVPQAISGVGALASVIIIDVRLTLILGGLMILVLIIQYPLNVKGAKHSQVFEEKLRQSGKAFAALGRTFISVYPENGKIASAIEEFYKIRGYRSAIQAFKGRIKILEESTLITETGSALVLSTAVFIIGSRLLHGGINWGSLLAYIVALRIALSGVVQIGRLFASISRFYPQLARYYELLSAEKTIKSISAPLIKGEQIVLTESKKLKKQIAFEIPQRIALYTPDPLDRSLLHLFNYANIIDNSGEIRSFATKPWLFLEPGEIIKAISGNRDANEFTGGDFVLLTADILESENEDLRKRLLDKLLVIIIYSDLNYSPMFGESFALFWIDSRLRGTADLRREDFRAASEEFKSFFAAKRGKESLKDVDEEVEDDEF